MKHLKSYKKFRIKKKVLFDKVSDKPYIWSPMSNPASPIPPIPVSIVPIKDVIG